MRILVRRNSVLYILFPRREYIQIDGKVFTSNCAGRIKLGRYCSYAECEKRLGTYLHPEQYLAWYTDVEWGKEQEWLAQYPDGYVDIAAKRRVKKRDKKEEKTT